MMSIGNFFDSATTCQPINPKPVTFTVIAKEKTLPNGKVNKDGRALRASVTAAFVFLGGDETAAARIDARRVLRKMSYDETTKDFTPYSDAELTAEFTYHLMWRALREWDPEEQKTGGNLFPSVDAMKKLVMLTEADRVCSLYNTYVKEEHPEVVDTATFPDPESGG